MKYAFHLLAGLLLLGIQLQAQITITGTSFSPSSFTGADTLKVATYDASYPALATGANVTWDLAGVTDSPSVFLAYRVGASGSTFNDSNTYSLLGFNYNGNIICVISDSAFQKTEIDINMARYDLFPITGLATDSLIIDSQNIIYSTPKKSIKFPASFHTEWSSSYSYNMHFKVSIEVFAYDHAPGYIRTYKQQRDSVTGWGKMMVNEGGGTPSDYWNVLQVRTRYITTDSIYINDEPATLLNSIGLPQSSTDTVYEESYYRLGEITPLAKLQYKDAAFTQPYKCTTHVQRLVKTAVIDYKDKNGIRVYPNPVSGESLFIDMPYTEPGTRYELVDAAGKICAGADLPGNVAHLHIALPDHITSGNYFLKIVCNKSLLYNNHLGIVK